MSVIPKPRGIVTNAYSGSSDETYNNSSNYPWIGLNISNDGGSDLTFQVNCLTLTVKSGETFDDDFSDFNSIIINSTVAYRLVLRS